MGQFLGRQTGYSDKGSPWLRDMTDEGQQHADERHSGAQRVGLEVEG